METKSAVLGAAGMLLVGALGFGGFAVANANNTPAPAVITSTTATATPEPTIAPEPAVTVTPEPVAVPVAPVEVAPVVVEPAPAVPEPVVVAPVEPAPAPVVAEPAPVAEPVQTGATYQLLPPGTVVSSPEQGAVINGPAMSTGNGKR
jgi:hypothetical protein